MTRKVCITGAASGIGLALTRHYHQLGDRVFASARKSNPDLEAVGVKVIDGIDVTSDEAISKLQKGVAGEPLDILINCAGLLCKETLDDMDFNRIEQQWLVNSIGPLKVTHALLKQLKHGSKIAMITSRMGSIGDNGSGGRYGYRMSKAALNAASVSLARDLLDEGIAVGILHPGLVSTKMIGFQGDVSPEEAAQRLAQRIEDLSLSNSGTFWHANGEVLPW